MIRLAITGDFQGAAEYAAVAPRLQNASFVASGDSDHDAVLIHSTIESRAALALEAANAGKHVLVEAPFARNAGEADRVIEACHRRGVRLMVGQSLRFLPGIEAIGASLSSGKLGDPGFLRIHRWEPAGLAKKGETLLDRVVREIDVANWIFGSLPTEVYALSRQPTTDTATLGYLQLHFGFQGGGMALIDYSTALPQGRDYFSLSVIGSEGAAYMDDHRNTHLVYRGGEPTALISGQDTTSLLRSIQEFVDAIAEERQPTSSGADGRAALQVAEAVNQSIVVGASAHLNGGSYELS